MNSNLPTCILITGGSATRLRPLSLYHGKPMIFLMGQPLLYNLIRELKSHGISDLIFTSSGKNGEIRDYFSNGNQYGVNIRYCTPRKWLGTAGTIKHILTGLDSNITDPFMVIYGDSLLNANYTDLISFHDRNKADVTILYHNPILSSFTYSYHDSHLDNIGPRTNYGVLSIDKEGKLIQFQEKPAIIDKDAVGNANATVYMLNKSVLSYIPDDMESDFAEDLFPNLIESNVFICGYNIGENGYRIDLGTIDNLYYAHMAILNGGLAFKSYYNQVKPGFHSGNSSSFTDSSSLLHPLQIGDFTRIGKNTTISCSVVGNNVTIGSNCNIQDSVIFDNVNIGDNADIAKSIIGYNVEIGEFGTISPFSVIGSYSKVSLPKLFNKFDIFSGQIGRESYGVLE